MYMQAQHFHCLTLTRKLYLTSSRAAAMAVGNSSDCNMTTLAISGKLFAVGRVFIREFHIDSWQFSQQLQNTKNVQPPVI